MSSSYGQVETAFLQEHIKVQLKRVNDQLADIETMRDILTDEEYNLVYKNSTSQRAHFTDLLSDHHTGNITLISESGTVQLEIQAAIRKAFSTPQVIQMFTDRQPMQLRHQLQKNLSDRRQVVEILVALQKLGEPLNTQELKLLEQHMEEFQTVSNQIDIQHILTKAKEVL